MSSQEIKSEPLGEEAEGVNEELNDDIIKRAEDVSNICFDYEENIPIKEELKQEIKPEPLEEQVEGVHEELNDDIIKRAEDLSNICFDYEDDDDKIPIKGEIKQEIKTEHLDEDNIDVETHSCEDDQEKSDLQAMVEKLLIEKQTLQKDMDKFVELQVENQILKSEKNVLERQLEDKEKKLEDMQEKYETKIEHLEKEVEKLLQNQKEMYGNKSEETTDSTLEIDLNNTISKNIDEVNEEPGFFQAEEFNFSDPMVYLNESNSGTNHVTFEQLTIPDGDNDSSEENKKKVKKCHHSSDSDTANDHCNTKSKNNEQLTANGKRRLRSTRKEIRYDEDKSCLLYTSPSPRDLSTSRMPSSA